MSKFCPNCGNQLRDGVKFCEKCGSSVANQQPKKKITLMCPHCGSVIENYYGLCPVCGKSMNDQRSGSSSGVITICVIVGILLIILRLALVIGSI